MDLRDKLLTDYIYGPMTKEEVKLIPIRHQLTYHDRNIYIGTNELLDMFSDKLIPRES